VATEERMIPIGVWIALGYACVGAGVFGFTQHIGKFEDPEILDLLLLSLLFWPLLLMYLLGSVVAQTIVGEVEKRDVERSKGK
jgi:hypothetical protein